MYLDNCSILAAQNISKTSYVVDEYMHVPRKKTPKENPMYLSRKSRLSHWAVVSHWAVNDCNPLKAVALFEDVTKFSDLNLKPLDRDTYTGLWLGRPQS